MWLLAADSAAGNAAGAAGSAVGAAGAAELEESGFTSLTFEIRRSSLIQAALCERLEPKCY